MTDGTANDRRGSRDQPRERDLRRRGDRPRKGSRARREDDALLTGDAEYTDDVSVPGTTSLEFVRSRHAHARIEEIETAAAEAVDGVLAVYTWADVAASDAPGVLPVASESLDCDVPGHPVLARDRVRYHGQPVAAVVATDPYHARDAAEAADVSYDRLEAVVDPVDATADGAPQLFEGAPGNVAARHELGDAAATDEAFAAADRTVELDVENNRLLPTAIEPRAALAQPDDGRLTVTMTSQTPHSHRRKLSETLGVPERDLRVVAPDVGGGFGHKGHHHPGDALTAWAATELDRPVRWTATRSENYLAGAHGRDHRTYAELAVDDDGRIRGLRARTTANAGGYALGSGPVLPLYYGRLLSSQYRIPAVHCETTSVFTTTAPVHSYRGAGRPEAIYVTERLVDLAARELGIDPVELRRRNLLAPDAFPYETPTGATYDSGDYEPALDAALEAVGDAALDTADGESADGRYRGIGVACYVESTGGGFESGVVRVHPDGSVTVSAGTHSHGQGHGTTYARIVADELGVSAGEVDVVEGDTDRVPTGTGTFGSRSTVVGGNAVAESAREVREKARLVAAGLLEVDADDVVYDAHGAGAGGDTGGVGDDGGDGDADVDVDGGVDAEASAHGDGPDGHGAFHVVGAPDRSVPFERVAAAAYRAGLPDGLEPGLESTTFYEPDGTAYTFGTHAAVVAVEPETGEVEIERYVAVDDCGERIDPTIVEGQVHGGVVQGIGQALFEHAVYDENGQLTTGSLDGYAVPRAGDVPTIETGATVTPSPTNPLGVKGIGEAGTIAAPPAVVNAVVDALAPFGVDHLDMPITEERVWRATRD